MQERSSRDYPQSLRINAPSPRLNLLMVKALATALGVKPELLYDPPPVPDYPLSEYLIREAASEGVEEGLRRARRRRASGDA